MFASKYCNPLRKYNLYELSPVIALISALLKEGCSPDDMELLKS